MAGRSPARFLAPLALVGFAIALVIVIGASSSSGGDEESVAPVNRTSTTDAGTAESKPAKKRDRKQTTEKTYTIEPGDTPSGIAAANGISVERLLELNPD